MTSELTQEKLKAKLLYDESWGFFLRECKGGKYVAGWVNDQGYLMISIDGKEYRAHRLVFLYKTGKWPKGQVDHIDHNRLNNRWSNLRDANDSINRKNMSLYSNNKSGVCGVYWYKSKKLWQAYITINYKRKHLGYFKDLDEAIDARKAAESNYGFHKNHGRMTKTEFEPVEEVDRNEF